MEVLAMTKVLVTGGTGFIGSNLTRALVEQGFEVKVFDNNFRGKSSNLNGILEEIEVVEGDIRNYEDVQRAVNGIETVFHLAYINGTEYFYSRPRLVLDVGVRGQLNMIDAAEDAGVKNFIYASSSEVYQVPPQIPTPEEVPLSIPSVSNPRYSYGGGKIISELMLLHYADSTRMRRIIFRPHNVYGPNMGLEHVVPQIIKKMYLATNGFCKAEAEITIQGMGDETRAFCYVDDAVRGIMITAEKGANGDILHVGKDDEISIRSLIRTIAEICNVKVNINSGPLAEGGTNRRCPDITRLRKLGYIPQVDLNQGLSRTVTWYKNYYKENTPTK
jgi:UDP-glucose 4-epimerase